MKKNSNLYITIMLIISFWVPLAGIVLLFLTAKSYPELRKKILIATVTGFIVNYVLTICKQNNLLWFGSMN